LYPYFLYFVIDIIDILYGRSQQNSTKQLRVSQILYTDSLEAVNEYFTVLLHFSYELETLRQTIWLQQIDYVCVCVCVCTVNTQCIFKAKNVVLRSTPKSAYRLPAHKVPSKYSIVLINTKQDDLDVM
jgi:hypothetical protein